MEYRRFGDTYVVRIQRGEEILEQLTKLCADENIRLASIEGIGACDEIVFGLYDVETKQYHQTELKEEMEITSLNGSVSELNGEANLHLHVNVSCADGISRGGHLNRSVISGTCEIFIRCIDGKVGRAYEDVTGLNIFEFY